MQVKDPDFFISQSIRSARKIKRFQNQMFIPVNQNLLSKNKSSFAPIRGKTVNLDKIEELKLTNLSPKKQSKKIPKNNKNRRSALNEFMIISNVIKENPETFLKPNYVSKKTNEFVGVSKDSVKHKIAVEVIKGFAKKQKGKTKNFDKKQTTISKFNGDKEEIKNTGSRNSLAPHSLVPKDFTVSKVLNRKKKSHNDILHNLKTSVMKKPHDSPLPTNDDDSLESCTITSMTSSSSSSDSRNRIIKIKK